MTRIGPKPSIMNTFRSGAGNAMNTVIFSECPLNAAHKEGNPEGGKDKDGFAQPVGKIRQGGRKQPAQVSKDPSTSNKYAILQDQPENPSTLINPNELHVDNPPQSMSQGEERSSQGKELDDPP
jgi:hypothetical protein